MNDEPKGLSAAKLLQKARMVDPTISARQLARWHQSGLLPTPTQHGLGRGRGTVTIYPPAAERQLSRLLQIRSSDPRLKSAAWQIWWEGYEVPDFKWRPVVLTAARDLSQKIDLLKANGFGAGVDDNDELSEQPPPSLNDAKYKKTSNQVFRRIRKRLSAEALETLLLQAVGVALGEWVPPSQRDPTGEDSPKDHGIILRGMGLHTPSERPGLPASRVTGLLLERTFEEISRRLAGFDIVLMVQTTSIAEIENARDELSQLLDLLGHTSSSLPNKSRKRLQEADMIRLLSGAPIIDKAQMLCVWISLEKSGQIRSAARLFLQEQSARHGREQDGHVGS